MKNFKLIILKIIYNFPIIIILLIIKILTIIHKLTSNNSNIKLNKNKIW